jgi:hypothetical protein
MKLMYYIKTLVFGKRAEGEKISQPTLPPERDYNGQDYIRWCQEFKVGSRYGHRGSFYQR